MLVTRNILELDIDQGAFGIQLTAQDDDSIFGCLGAQGGIRVPVDASTLYGLSGQSTSRDRRLSATQH